MQCSAQTMRLGARPFAGTRVSAAKNGARVVAKAGNWLPGSDTPAYLESLPASYGFGECAPWDRAARRAALSPAPCRRPGPVGPRSALALSCAVRSSTPAAFNPLKAAEPPGRRPRRRHTPTLTPFSVSPHPPCRPPEPGRGARQPGALHRV
jgi:hypothetical protein